MGTTCQIHDKSSEEYNIATLLHVLQLAPRGIHAFIASRQGPISRKQRMIWSIDTLATPQFPSVTTFWLPKRVIMTVRQLSKGPLRDFMLMCKAKQLLILDQLGCQQLVNKTHISYPIDTQRPKILYVLLPSQSIKPYRKLTLLKVGNANRFQKQISSQMRRHTFRTFSMQNRHVLTPCTIITCKRG